MAEPRLQSAIAKNSGHRADLFGNWNRYYEPSTGRYLQPEPIAQVPARVRQTAQKGFAIPAYAYAANNPLRFADPNGREFIYFDPSLRDVIRSLERDPVIGPLVLLFDVSQRYRIFLNQGDCGLATAGGGLSSWDLGPRGGTDIGTVEYNLAISSATLESTFGFSQSLAQLIAHELGHEYSYSREIGPGFISDLTAINWENTQRDHDFRSSHQPGNMCSRPVTCP